MAEKEKSKEHKVTPTEEMFTEVLGILNAEKPSDAELEGIEPEALLESLETTLADLKEESEKLVSQSGMTADELAAYSQNPDNFTPEEWQLLTQIREQLDGYRRQAKEFADKGPEMFLPEGEQAEAAPPAKKKKKGGKKKGWMQM